MSAPCGRWAMDCISRKVVPRDPVEPAKIIGCSGGDVFQPSVNAKTLARWRVSTSGVAPCSKYRCTILINLSALSQCPETSETSRLVMASGAIPSPCISSINAAKLLARSNTALRGAKPSTWLSSWRTNWAISSRRRRAGTGIGRSVSVGCLAKSVTK